MSLLKYTSRLLRNRRTEYRRQQSRRTVRKLAQIETLEDRRLLAVGDLVQTLLPQSMQTAERQGSAVSISDNYRAVGAPGADVGSFTDSGVVRVYDDTNTLLHTIHNPTPANDDNFGASVASSGNLIIVGAPKDDAEASDAGVAYIFDMTSATPTSPMIVLSDPLSIEGVAFGQTISAFESYVVVGAPGSGAGGPSAGIAYVFDLSSASPEVPILTLNNPSENPNYNNFGSSIMISGDHIVVGAPGDSFAAYNAGSAYLYDLKSPTPSVPSIVIHNPSPGVGDKFGSAVSVSGPFVVIAANTDDSTLSNAGSVYVYDTGAPNAEVPLVTLDKPNVSANDLFGYSLGQSQNYVIVGAIFDDANVNNSGSAYVYDLASQTPAVSIVTLNNPSPAAEDYFGGSVAISGNSLVVGASGDDSSAMDAGRAYVFDLLQLPSQVPVAVLDSPSPARNDNFGQAVALSDDYLVASSRISDSINDGVLSGSVYVYNAHLPALASPLTALKSPSPTNGDGFGNSLAISGGTVLVGSNSADVGATDAGTVYAFDLDSPTPDLPFITIHNPSPTTNDKFGTSVSLLNNIAVIGAPDDDFGAENSGSVYVFDLAAPSPSTPLVTLNNPSPNSQDYFGRATAISERYIAIGAPHDDTYASGAGIAYVYDLASITPSTPVITLGGSMLSAGSLFGSSIAISNGVLAVGAHGHSDSAVGEGRVFIFDLDSQDPTIPVAMLNNPAPDAFDWFGYSVAIEGTSVLVGSYSDDSGASASGAAYVYDLMTTAPEVPIAMVSNPGTDGGDQFGRSVAISNQNIVVAAPLNDTSNLNQGAVYLFEGVSRGLGPTVAVENGAPNNGDGNADGILDSEQANVASLPSVTGEYITLESTAGNLLGVTVSATPPGASLPMGAQFPTGFISYSIASLAVGQATTVTLFVPNGEAYTTYYKYGPTPQDTNPHWYEFTYDGQTGAQFFDDDNNGETDRIILHFVDGLRGDDDLAANGTILDPGAPAITAPSYTTTFTEDEGPVLAQDSGLTLPGATAPAGPLGNEFQVNTITADRQELLGWTGGRTVATTPDGNSVIVWTGRGPDGSEFGVLGQRYDASGAPQGGEFLVNTYTNNDQSYPSVAMDAAGNFVVVWTSTSQDGSGYGIYGQRYDASGNALGGEFRVNSFTSSHQAYPSIAMDAAGGFVVAWSSLGQDGDGYGVYAQRYDASGVKIAGEFQVNAFTAKDQSLPSVAMNANGEFAVAWESLDQDGSSYGIYAQRYDAAGNPAGGEFQVNSFTADRQQAASVALDGAGNLMITWTSLNQDGSTYGIYAQRYLPSGTPAGGEFLVNSFTNSHQLYPSVAMNASGHTVVTWMSIQDGDGYGVYAQQYDAAGLAVGGEFRVNSYTAGSQGNPSVAMDAEGNYIVAWTSDGQDGSSEGVFAQRRSGGFQAAPPVEQATVTITNPLDGADETLAANTQGTSITASYASGVLTLSGNDTAANYQQVLRSVTYNNTSQNPDNTPRTIEFTYTTASVTSPVALTTLTVIPVNDSPTISVNQNPVSVGEGAVAENSGGFGDVDGAGPMQLTTSIGTVVDNGNGTWTWSRSTLDGPGESQLVTVTATDAFGASATATFDLTVHNVAPTFSNLESTSVLDENGVATVSGVVIDPSVEDSRQVTIDWGDGGSEAVPLVPHSPGLTPVSDRTATDVDLDGQFDTVSSDGIYSHILELQANQESRYALEIDLTDFATTDTLLSATLSLTRTGGTPDGQGTIEVFGYTGDGLVDEDDVEFSYRIAGPFADSAQNLASIDLRSFIQSRIFIGATHAGIVLRSTTVGPQNFIASANNPNLQLRPKLQLEFANRHDFEVSHQYLDDPKASGSNDKYSIVLNASDDDGGSTSVPLQITVNNVVPTATLSGPSTAIEDQQLTFTLAAHDVSPTDLAAGFLYDVDFGDGNSTQITATAGNATGVTLVHRYLAAGAYNVSVTATDVDGGTSAAASRLVNVAAITSGGLQASIEEAIAGGGSEPIIEMVASTEAGLDSLIAAIGDISLDANAPPVQVVLDLGGIQYGGKAISVPPGVTVVIENGSLTGASPALTVNSGVVVANNITFNNSTLASTILVHGGTLVLRGSLVNETDGGNFAAIEILGGSVDLGTGANPGGNTLMVRGPGQAIRNATSEAISALGNDFQVDGAALASGFQIENIVEHRLDAAGAGLVTWETGHVYVTHSSGSVQRGVDAVSHEGSVHVELGVDEAYDAGDKLLTVAYQDGPTLIAQINPYDATQRELVVIGTQQRDKIDIKGGDAEGAIEVAIKEKHLGKFKVKNEHGPTIDRIVVYGLGGDDDIKIHKSAGAIASELYGGPGDDKLRGGEGDDYLSGGDGDDVISGKSGRDVMIGGLGKDKIDGDDGDDILIGGVYIESENRAAAHAITLEWFRTDLDYAARVDHLINGGGLNGGFLINATTVFDDNAKDKLRGKKGLDWFLADADDDKTDADLDELLTEIELDFISAN